jgi:hypothetical protein
MTRSSCSFVSALSAIGLASAIVRRSQGAGVAPRGFDQILDCASVGTILVIIEKRSSATIASFVANLLLRTFFAAASLSITLTRARLRRSNRLGIIRGHVPIHVQVHSIATRFNLGIAALLCRGSGLNKSKEMIKFVACCIVIGTLTLAT